MRNLKRVLALAMAMVMILGMMVIGSSAASYTDAAAIDEDYAEAIEILTGMGVFEGTGKGFEPKTTLDRASAAALIYRVITGDVKNEKVELYDYPSFTDTVEGAWYNGYVTYAANGNYIVGDGTGNFNPNAKVTGVQVLKIMLRAMGYGANGEFEGAAWSDNVLTVADDLDLLDNVKGNDLNLPATRELVAQLLFDAIQAPTTNYTPAFGYNTPWGDETSIAVNVFKLAKTADADEWGRPSVVWFKNTNGNEDADKNPIWDKLAKGAKAEPVYATIAEAPIATYTAAVADCDIANDMGMKKSDKVDFCVNGVWGEETITLTKQAKENGGQGTLLEVYEDCVVVINTYLAKVGNAVTEKTDKNGHVIREAYTNLTVYGSDETVALKGNDYEKDAYILVNVNENAANDITINEKKYAYIEVVDYADSAVGKVTGLKGNIRVTDDIQKVVAIAKEDVTVNETACMDTMMGLDEVYTFYYDQYGNVIGSAALTENYVVVDSLYMDADMGDYTIYADIVDFSAEETEDIVVDSIDHPSTVNYLKAWNSDFYYQVYTYAVEDGEYTLAKADFDYIYAANYVKGDKYFWGEGADNAMTKDGYVGISKTTKVLLQNTASPDGTYTAYVGYEELPTFTCTQLHYIDANNDGYAELVYAYGTTITTRTVFIADTAAVRTDSVDDGNVAVVTMNAYELVDGELVKTTFKTTGAWTPEYGWQGLNIDTIGLYEIYESGDGYTWIADDAADYYAVETLTTDGNRVGIDIDDDNDYDYFDLDDAVLFKFEGTWNKVSDKTEADEWSKRKLNDESIVILQYNEKHDVIAVYDLWLELGVKAAEGVTYVADTFYLGKTPAATQTVKITSVPAGKEIDAVKSDSATFGLVADTTATYNYTAGALWNDIEITVDAIPAAHEDYRLASITKIWDESKIVNCALNTTGYAELEDACAAIAELKLDGAETLSIVTPYDTWTVEYAVYTSTAEALADTAPTYGATSGLTAEILADYSTLVLKITNNSGFRLADDCLADTLYVVYEII